MRRSARGLTGRMGSRRLTVLGIAGVLALAGCGGGDGEDTASGGEDTFSIGVFGPAQVPQGADIRDAATLAVEQLNANGGFGGRQAEVIFCDSVDGAQPDQAIQCATQFVSENEVDAVVGGFSSGETAAMLQTVVDGETPFVATGAAAPDIVAGVDSTGPRKYIFRIGPINSRFLAADMCVTMVTKLAPATGFTKFGILYEDTEFARPLQEFLQACLPAPAAASMGAIPVERGVEVVGVEKHGPADTDFSAQFSSLESKGAQFVIEINSRQEGVALVRQWGTLKPSFALGGINVASQQNAFFTATEGAAAYELNGPAGIVRAPISEVTIPFFDAFSAKFGRDPIYNGASTYDAIYALSEAVQRANSVEPAAIVTEMEKTDRVGAQGREVFGPNHDIVYGAGDPAKGVSPVFFQWLPDGTRKIAFPASLAEGNTYQPPPWLAQ